MAQPTAWLLAPSNIRDERSEVFGSRIGVGELTEKEGGEIRDAVRVAEAYGNGGIPKG